MARWTALAVLAGLTVTACASGPLGRAGVLRGRSLSLPGAVLVMAVPDARDESQQPLLNSGAAVAVAVRRQLQARGLEAVAAGIDGAADLPAAYRAARDLGCELVARAEILEWHEARSDWVHGGDRLAVWLTLWSVQDESLVAWGADELEDRSMSSGLQSTHRLAELLLGTIVAAILEPGATVPPIEEL